MSKRILVLPGDGIGPEIVAEAVKVLDRLAGEGLEIELDEGLVGGAAYDAVGTPLPDATLDMAREADAVLLGAVGGPKWEPLDISVRPEKGLLGLRTAMGLFSNLRPAILYPQLAAASSLAGVAEPAISRILAAAGALEVRSSHQGRIPADRATPLSSGPARV